MLIVGALLDAYPAGFQPRINLFEFSDMFADFSLGPIGMFDIVEGDFERNLHNLTPRFIERQRGHRAIVSRRDRYTTTQT